MKTHTKVINFILLFSVFSSCSEKTPIYDKYLQEINQDFLFSKQREYDVSIWLNGGSLVDNIKKIDLGFQINHVSPEIDDARNILMKFVNDYVEKINSSTKIR